jgi:predicted MPP superfamily phosphohydrolase
MNATDLAIFTAAVLGHAALWIVAVNHLQARNVPRWLLELICWPMRFIGLLGPAGLLLAAQYYDLTLVGRTDWSTIPWGLAFYVGFCAVIAIIGLPTWLYWAVRHQQAQVTDHHAVVQHDLAEHGKVEHSSLKNRVLAAIPGNEYLQLDVTEKSLALKNLPVELDGLTIAHLSDLHFTGDIAAAWYHEVVRLTHELDADLIVITGDIVEEPECIEWLGAICGQLRARHGVYFVLGNHDTRIDYQITRRELTAAGLVDLGGRWHTLEINGQQLLLAGNELPWITPAADPRACPIDTANSGNSLPVRICVAHSPDQFPWAREHGFDLMLAGHTHGGQIRFPVIGPIVCPSKFGVRYASGTYFEPPTLMHVSRGLSGDTLIRWNCRPELTRLTLRSRVRPIVDDEQAEPATVGE